MPKGFQPGSELAGRPKGAQNKEAQAIRAAFANLLENKMTDVEDWLDEIKEHDPAKAFELMLKMTDFILPKLKAIENSFSSEDGVQSIKIEVVKNNDASKPENE